MNEKTAEGDPGRVETPVVFVIYNRPDPTAKVFAEIRKARPRNLLVVADGPRAEIAGDDEKCAATRAIVGAVDWECDLQTDFAAANMGCDRRMRTGLTWAFGKVGEAIILEDDCMPHPTFFRFSQELLELYRHDTRVFAICGTNFADGDGRTPYSYYFGRVGGIWGWATWRRAWDYYDYSMALWPEINEDRWMADLFEDRRLREYWSTALREAAEGTQRAWSYRWAFACLIQSGLGIYPCVNLISNIGFEASANRTRDVDSFLANSPTEAMTWPLRHPPFVIRNRRREHAIHDKLKKKTPGWIARENPIVRPDMGHRSIPLTGNGEAVDGPETNHASRVRAAG